MLPHGEMGISNHQAPTPRLQHHPMVLVKDKEVRLGKDKDPAAPTVSLEAQSSSQ